MRVLSFVTVKSGNENEVLKREGRSSEPMNILEGKLRPRPVDLYAEKGCYFYSVVIETTTWGVTNPINVCHVTRHIYFMSEFIYCLFPWGVYGYGKRSSLGPVLLRLLLIFCFTRHVILS